MTRINSAFRVLGIVETGVIAHTGVSIHIICAWTSKFSEDTSRHGKLCLRGLILTMEIGIELAEWADPLASRLVRGRWVRRCLSGIFVGVWIVMGWDCCVDGLRGWGARLKGDQLWWRGRLVGDGGWA